MKRLFKIGDRVIHNTYGKGVVKSIDDDSVPYGVEFKSRTGCDARDCKKNHGYWCHENFLTGV